MFGICLLFCHMPTINIKIFIDEYSQFTWIYFLHSKSEVFHMFKMSCTLTLVVESTCVMPFRNTCNKKISFLNVLVLVHLSKMPWQKYQHLLDITQPLLLAASFSTKFWVEAQSKVVFLIICLPSQVLWFDSPFFFTSFKFIFIILICTPLVGFCFDHFLPTTS